MKYICARRANRNYPTYIHPPNCWHDISNTNIYIQLTFIPPIFGSICSIQIYISTNLYSQTLRLKGAQKLQQYIQPPSVGLIYIQYPHMFSTDIYSPNCWLHICPTRYLYLKNVKGILEGPVWSRIRVVQNICAYMPFLSFHHFEQFSFFNYML